jgi:hypothetical protein
VSFVLDNSVALTWCFEDERVPRPRPLALLDQDLRAAAGASGLDLLGS